MVAPVAAEQCRTLSGDRELDQLAGPDRSPEEDLRSLTCGSRFRADKDQLGEARLAKLVEASDPVVLLRGRQHNSAEIGPPDRQRQHGRGAGALAGCEQRLSVCCQSEIESAPD